jgi:hypothetical protein
MSDTRTILHAKVRDAKEAQKALEYKIKQLAREAARKVEESFDAELNAHYRATSEAERALREHIDQTATHEWEGKRVVKTITKHQRWGDRSWTEKVYGVVEVRRSGTEFPASQRWGLPEQGEAFVRLLKEDGKPGLQLSRYDESNWALATETVEAK